MNVLVTGGAGYIGSHVVEELRKTGFTPIVYDNLSTGHAAAVSEEVQLVEGDIHNIEFLKHVIDRFEIDAVMHFAASSLVGESMTNPAKYYFNNVEGTLHLLEAMRTSGVDKIVFSSTAAVYGEPLKTPIEESAPLQPTNVYGRTKVIIEKILADYSKAYGINYTALRYFNAAGASLDGHIGEDHNPESHLIPLILKTALGH
jgi:UDP-glucose 4-epimerase